MAGTEVVPGAWGVVFVVCVFGKRGGVAAGVESVGGVNARARTRIDRDDEG